MVMIVYFVFYLLCSFLIFPIGPWYYHIMVPYIGLHILYWMHRFVHIDFIHRLSLTEYIPEWISKLYYLHNTTHHTFHKPSLMEEFSECFFEIGYYIYLPLLLYPIRHSFSSYSLLCWLWCFFLFCNYFHHSHNSHLYEPNYHTYHHQNPNYNFNYEFIDSIYGTVDPKWKGQRDISFDHYETLIMIALLFALFYQIANAI